MKIFSAHGLENLHKAGLVALIAVLTGACVARAGPEGGEIVRPVISETLGATGYEVGEDALGTLCVTTTSRSTSWTECGGSEQAVLAATSGQELSIAGFIYPPARGVTLITDGARRHLTLSRIPDSDALAFGSVLAPPPDLISLEVVDGAGNILETRVPTINEGG